jgi:hypothetical protein
MIIYLYETLSTALSSFAYLSKQSHHLLKHGLMANCSNCHEWADTDCTHQHRNKKPGLKPGFFNSVSPTSYFAGVILAT